MAVIKSEKENFKIVPIEKLIPSPRNNNRHSIEQLERLAKIIEHRGFREPLTVSKRSGFVVCGHARLEAAKILGMNELPVIYQDFENEAEEYSHMTADNEIARWAELDMHDVYTAIEEMPDIDIELLGIKQPVKIDEPEMPDLGDGTDPDIQSMTFTVSNEQADIIRGAMSKAKDTLDHRDEINQNENGNLIGAVCRTFLYD